MYDAHLLQGQPIRRHPPGMAFRMKRLPYHLAPKTELRGFHVQAESL